MVARQFTVDEANQLLEPLRELLTTLQTLQRQARLKYEEMRDIREVGYRKDGNLIMLSDYQLAKQEFDQVVADANGVLADINQMGCRVTDVEMGLVDFPSEREGEPIYLCWKMDEPSVLYYHGVDEGFSGRKRLESSSD
ncbi:MAG: DUF2203 domain-containing protein [Sulfobacillus thermosulfidooxidans]|uniref:DUF2203 domain-containing protein n=1 Tax=Sulfobacillus thermotolerans TaxID=338644 RepID=A0ABM6RPV3_9FIRM|nr:hypothetical protein BXT84_04470 [Sulfobacillus thermotolerans]MCY0907362.1 DUF2203 domain-containing protein [Sulfobacillus thermotolerans]PSR32911.1 MAG: DUF2203 domain-containing protein [Sulfobacillus thermosulfidooxidans]